VPFDEVDDVAVGTAVSWKKSVFATGHDVYFGQNETSVTDANRSNPLGVLVSRNQAAATTTYDPPGNLELGKTYYWRVDEVNSYKR
jgi:hypothetical protein